jgi:uncharacterized integral membrane protein
MSERLTLPGVLASLGPGLVWAAAAIGVSHLVQSTRAGASYGFALVGVVVLANVLKYPFFEYGPRYAAATGESLVDGYRRQGLWAVWIYLVLTIGTMFAVLAAVTLVTGSLATQLFGEALSPLGYSAILLAVSAVLLIPGQYPLLDKVVKAIMVVLALSTVARWWRRRWPGRSDAVGAARGRPLGPSHLPFPDRPDRLDAVGGGHLGLALALDPRASEADAPQTPPRRGALRLQPRLSRHRRSRPLLPRPGRPGLLRQRPGGGREPGRLRPSSSSTSTPRRWGRGRGRSSWSPLSPPCSRPPSP